MAINDNRVVDYGPVFEVVDKQQRSALRGNVDERRVVGKSFTVERLDDDNDVLPVVSTRHADTAFTDVEHDRRVGHLTSYRDAVRIDDEDQVRMLADPTNGYLMMLARRYNRTIDSLLIEALLGVAYIGEAGTSTSALPSAQVIAHGSAALTLAKLKQARKIMMQGFLDLDRNVPMLAIAASGWEDLSVDTGATSLDNVNYQVNQFGVIKQLAGFQVIDCERLAVHTGQSAASTNRPAIAFVKSAVRFGVGMDKQVTAERVFTKGNDVCMMIKGTMGAVRAHDNGVVDIRYQE